MFKNRLLKIISILCFAIILLILLQNSSNASTLSVSTSKSSVSPGESFSVTVSVSGGAGYVNLSASNGTLSSTKLDLMLQSSVTVTCTAGSSGTVSIYASGVIADYVTESDENKSVYSSVTIVQPAQPSKPSTSAPSNNGGGNSASGGTTNKKPTTTTKPSNQTTTKEEEKSKDSSLTTLAVAEGVLTPEFNKEVKEYTLTIPNEVTTVNVAATTNDKKASYIVEGNTELKEGENIVTITVKAEDGSTTDYVIKVTRARPELSLKSLIIKYTNQNGELVELPLTPTFSFDIYDYKLEDLEYWVEKLDIEAIANIEGATIEIQGNEELKIGENIITIIAKIPVTVEGDVATEEEGKETEEIKTYTIRFNKKEEPAPPTLMGRIYNWFNGMLAGVSAWYTQNQTQIIMGSLALCIVALIGLSVYIVIDYKKYKLLLDKLKKVNEINNTQAVEDIETQSISETEANEDKDNKPKGGKHF